MFRGNWAKLSSSDDRIVAATTPAQASPDRSTRHEDWLRLRVLCPGFLYFHPASTVRIVSLNAAEPLTLG